MGRKLVQNQKTKPQLSKRYLIPSILMVGFVPLIMRMHIYNTHLSRYDWFPASDGATDIFLQYKQWAVVVLACICLLILLVRVKYYYEDLPLEKFMISAGIYGIMVLLSAIFGKSPLFAFAGSYDMFESALAILSFLVICYYTYVSVVSLDHLLYFLRGSEYFVLVELLIAFFQSQGKDFFLTGLGKRLILPSAYWGQFDNVQSVSAANDAYGTIFNPDYFSMYLGVLIPIFIALILCEQAVWRKAFNAGLCVLGIFVMFKAAASGGVGIAGAVFIVLLAVSSGRKKPFFIVLGILAACIIGGICVLVINHPIRDRVSSLIGNDGVHVDDVMPLKEVRTGQDYAVISFKDGRELHLSYTVDNETGVVDFSLTDGEGTSLGLQISDEEAQIYVFSDPQWKDCYVGRYGNPAAGQAYYVYLFMNDRILPFQYVANRGYLYMNPAMRTVELPENPQPEMAKVFSDGLFSGRGFIYNHCVPLLKHFIFIGAGANNFVLAYPQGDYLRRLFGGQNAAVYDVKPHSAYLQQWMEEGLIGLFALIVFFGWYLYESARIYRKAFWVLSTETGASKEEAEKQKKLVRMGIGLFAGVLSYLIVVLVNDSTICTAPVFWTLAGAALAVNSLVKKQMPEYKPAAEQTTKKK